MPREVKLDLPGDIDQQGTAHSATCPRCGAEVREVMLYVGRLGYVPRRMCDSGDCDWQEAA